MACVEQRESENTAAESTRLPPKSICCPHLCWNAHRLQRFSICPSARSPVSAGVAELQPRLIVVKTHRGAGKEPGLSRAKSGLPRVTPRPLQVKPVDIRVQLPHFPSSRKVESDLKAVGFRSTGPVDRQQCPSPGWCSSTTPLYSPPARPAALPLPPLHQLFPVLRQEFFSPPATSLLLATAPSLLLHSSMDGATAQTPLAAQRLRPVQPDRLFAFVRFAGVARVARSVFLWEKTVVSACLLGSSVITTLVLRYSDRWNVLSLSSFLLFALALAFFVVVPLAVRVFPGLPYGQILTMHNLTKGVGVPAPLQHDVEKLAEVLAVSIFEFIFVIQTSPRLLVLGILYALYWLVSLVSPSSLFLLLETAAFGFPLVYRRFQSEIDSVLQLVLEGLRTGQESLIAILNTVVSMIPRAQDVVSQEISSPSAPAPAHPARTSEGRKED